MPERTEAFFQAVPGEAGRFAAERVDDLLAEALALAHAALPGLQIDDRRFIQHLAGRVEPDQSLAAALEVLNVADLYLACGCLAGDAAAIDRFVQTYLTKVGKYLARLNPEPSLVDEVRQELSRKLLVGEPPDQPRIATYHGRGSLEAWVAVSAQRA